MSPAVPISLFVDDQTMEPTLSLEQTVRPGTRSPLEFDPQLRAQLEECEALSPDPDAGEIAQETDSGEVARSKPMTHKRATHKPGVLSTKQQRFVDECLVDLNATQAAVRAGYSKRTARSIGCENLTKPDIQTKIQDRLREVENKTDLDRVRVLKGLMQIADADIGQLFDQDGRLLPVEAWPAGTAPAVKYCRSVVTGKPGTQNHRRVTTIVLQDKARALSTLLDYLAPRPKTRRSGR